MSGYSNENSGVLFKNKDKKTEKHPDYRGDLDVGGEPFYLSAWLKTSKAGEKYMSLALQPKGQPKVESKSAGSTPFDLDDEIPF